MFLYLLNAILFYCSKSPLDFLEVLPEIEAALKECDFIAIDAEFTGKLCYSMLEYTYMCYVYREMD